MSKTAIYYNGLNEFEYDVLRENPDGTVDLGIEAVDAKAQPVLSIGKCPVSATAKIGSCVLTYKREETKVDPKRPIPTPPMSTEEKFAQQQAEIVPPVPLVAAPPAVAPAHPAPLPQSHRSQPTEPATRGHSNKA